MNSGKYKIENNQIVNIVTGVPIPDDEPVFILRAQDSYASNTIEFYAELADTDPFASDVDKCLKAFDDWQKANPTKINEPD